MHKLDIGNEPLTGFHSLEDSAAADVLDLLDKIDAANVAIDANTKWIAEYKATTEKVVEAVFGVEKVWTLCNTYCVGWGEIAADELLYVKEQAKVDRKSVV